MCHKHLYLLKNKEYTMKRRIAILAIIGLFASFTSFAQIVNPHPMDMAEAIQNAKTSADHEELANHYEDAAKDMQLMAQEYKKRLGPYKRKSHIFGKSAQHLQAHCKKLIKIYEQAAEENKIMADSHRKMAAEAK
ncbi:conserved exported hypothetical protein [Nitrosomonas mobilis]|uniref:Uncharacterized protein n=2 Tax=Nitrosomonas mobilis TaxID=51642 RepID=A0A1G5SEH3_9PROT|nr:conserved exported hypothetical protein [Nitrosomonas mobilis]